MLDIPQNRKGVVIIRAKLQRFIILPAYPAFLCWLPQHDLLCHHLIHPIRDIWGNDLVARCIGMHTVSKILGGIHLQRRRQLRIIVQIQIRNLPLVADGLCRRNILRHIPQLAIANVAMKLKVDDKAHPGILKILPAVIEQLLQAAGKGSCIKIRCLEGIGDRTHRCLIPGIIDTSVQDHIIKGLILICLQLGKHTVAATAGGYRRAGYRGIYKIHTVLFADTACPRPLIGAIADGITAEQHRALIKLGAGNRRILRPIRFLFNAEITQSRQKINAVAVFQGDVVDVNIGIAPVRCHDIELCRAAGQGDLIVAPVGSQLTGSANDGWVTVGIGEQHLAGIGGALCPQTQGVAFSLDHIHTDGNTRVFGRRTDQTQSALILISLGNDLTVVGVIPGCPGRIVGAARGVHYAPLAVGRVISARGAFCIQDKQPLNAVTETAIISEQVGAIFVCQC